MRVRVAHPRPARLTVSLATAATRVTLAGAGELLPASDGGGGGAGDAGGGGAVGVDVLFLPGSSPAAANAVEGRARQVLARLRDNGGGGDASESGGGGVGVAGDEPVLVIYAAELGQGAPAPAPAPAGAPGNMTAAAPAADPTWWELSVQDLDARGAGLDYVPGRAVTHVFRSTWTQVL